MTYPQSNLEQIIDSERSMLVDAYRRYGNYYKHARTTTIYLSKCITSIEIDRAEMFGRLFSLTKKQHTLSVFSTLRLHKVQAMMDLRQVLEAGASAAFAIANPETEHFADIDAFGIMDPSKKLARKRYCWLEKNYQDKSNWIKSTKYEINKSMAHSNIISADSNFRIADDRTAVSTPFFDIEDEYFVKIDLWLISSVAIALMYFFHTVAGNVAEAGRSVIDFTSDFQQTIQGLASENRALQNEIQDSDRFQRVMHKTVRQQQV